MEREVGGEIGMGNTCKPMAVSFQCMTKSTTNKQIKRVFSNTTVQKINSLAFSFLYSPILTSIHDYWKNHNLD